MVQTDLSFEEVIIMAERVKQPVQTDPTARSTPISIAYLFATRKERGAADSDPASAEQDAYTAAARYFLDVSRAYLALRNAADADLTHPLRSDGAGGVHIQHLRLAFDRTISSFPTFKSRGEHVAQ
jgi:hypothetical protein